VEYTLKLASIKDAKLRFLIVDEAHNSRNFNGTMNHAYRLIRAKELV
jgi:hypothetical protein